MEYLAKLTPDNRPGVSVLEHMRIVGTVARLLADMYPDWLRKCFFPTGTELLAGGHDVGKITPAFQEKLYRKLVGYMPNSLPELADTSVADPQKERLWGYHSNVSALTLKKIGLSEKQCAVVGKHHGNWQKGKNPTMGAGSESLGGDVWQNIRQDHLQALKEYFDCSWPCVADWRHTAVLAGLTSVADWIGSGEIFADGAADEAVFCLALEQAGFMRPGLVAGLSFADIFTFSPNAVQSHLASLCTGPGLYLVEAPMGMGKTEAALFAAYLALAEGRATGIYFALPTQLTSNSIYARVIPFLKKILEADAPCTPAMLLHGMAFLEQTDMGAEGSPGSSWYSSLKRAILAPFGVGTLDQALLSALPDARHSFVRAFGLLGKVVILDEIHSYDAYTLSLIQEFLDILQELRCTVIILSATLTVEKRRELLGAASSDMAYPLMSCRRFSRDAMRSAPFCKHAQAAEHEECAVAGAHSRMVALLQTNCRESALNEARSRAAAGQQVLWIENTVGEAQKIFQELQVRSREEGYKCGLLHARFLQWQRQKLEEKWVGLYGKNAGAERSRIGRILVGTQVLEQSLDIDADCLFTALCPVDMFLQRLGRLWRHEHTPRPVGAEAEAFLLLPQEEKNAIGKEYFGRSGKVYEPYILYRTMRFLRDRQTISLPGDIRDCLEAVYRDQEESDLPAHWRKQWIETTEKLKTHAGLAASELGAQRKDDETLQTRYIEERRVSVLLARSLRAEDKGLRLVLADDAQVHLPMQPKPPAKEERKKLSSRLLRNTVSVADYMAPEEQLPQSLWNALKFYVYLGDRENPLFRVGIVEDSEDIRAVNGGQANSRYTLRYSNLLGYVAQKREGRDDA